MFLLNPSSSQVAGDATYEGGWLNGQKHGQGSLTLKARWTLILVLQTRAACQEHMQQDGSKYVGDRLS